MKAYRPSRYGGPEVQEMLAQMEAREARVAVYERRVQDGLPVFDSPQGPEWAGIRRGLDADRPDGYRIIWQHVETGRTEIGLYTFPSLEVARTVARAMDALWPEIRHWPIAAREVAERRPAGASAYGPGA